MKTIFLEQHAVVVNKLLLRAIRCYEKTGVLSVKCIKILDMIYNLLYRTEKILICKKRRKKLYNLYFKILLKYNIELPFFNQRFNNQIILIDNEYRSIN